MRRVLEYRGREGKRTRGIGALASDCRVVGGILWVCTVIEGVGMWGDVGASATSTWQQALSVGSVLISGVLGTAYVVTGQRLARSGQAGVRRVMWLAVLHGAYWVISLAVTVGEVLTAHDIGVPLLTFGALGMGCLLMGLPAWMWYWSRRELRVGGDGEMEHSLGGAGDGSGVQEG